MSIDELDKILPESWEIVTIGEITLPYETEQPAKKSETEFKYIDIGSIDNSTQTITNIKKFLGKDAPSRARRIVRKNDILFSTVRTYLKNIARVPAELDGVLTSTGIAVLRCTSGIDTNFLFYSVLSDKFIRKISSTMDGTLYPAVTDTDVTSAAIVIPPLNEQRRIVAKIEALSARSQRVKEALEDIPQLLDQFRQSVLAAAFRGDLTADWREQNSNVEPAEVLLERIRAERRRRWEEAELEKMKASGKTPKDDKWKDKYIEPEAVSNEELPEIPEGWTWTDINNISFVVRGASPRPAGDPKYFGGNIPWITVAEITKDDEIYLTYTSGFVTEEGCRASRFIEPGTFLLTNSGATLGVPKITQIGGCINDGSVALLFVNGEIEIYLYYFLKSLTQILRKINQGAAQPNLNTEIVRNIKIPIPPQEELQVIIKLLKHQLSTVSELKTLVRNKLELAVTLDQSILAKAFRGELVPQDPNDEPASVLLERIRAERDKLQTKAAKKSTPPTGGRRSKKASQQEEESVQLELGLE